MRSIKTFAAGAAGALLLMTSGGLFVLSSASATPEDPDHKIRICHATSAVNNPYTDPDVDMSSVDEANNWDYNGHGDHTGPVFDPDGGKDQPVWGDIIPPFTYTFTKKGKGQDPDVEVTVTFPGQNWSEAGQAIYRNGCSAPTPTQPPTGVFFAAPGFSDPTCESLEALVTGITGIEGVTFDVSPKPAPGVKVTVTGTLDEGYEWSDGTTAPRTWEWTFGAEAENCTTATPTTPVPVVTTATPAATTPAAAATSPAPAAASPSASPSQPAAPEKRKTAVLIPPVEDEDTPSGEPEKRTTASPEPITVLPKTGATETGAYASLALALIALGTWLYRKAHAL